MAANRLLFGNAAAGMSAIYGVTAVSGNNGNGNESFSL